MENLTQSIEILENIIKLAKSLGYETENITLDKAFELKTKIDKVLKETLISN